MDSKSLLRLVRYHWAVVLVCAVLGVLAGQAVAAITPREYTASADVFVTVTGGSTTGEVAQSGNFAQQQARNFGAVATREVVLAPVVEQLALPLTLGELRKLVSASVQLNTSVITISATDRSPDRAAAIANAVALNLSEVAPSLTPRVDGESPVRLQVIESAAAPANPSSPNVVLLLILGLLGGLVAATVVVVLRGVVDARVRSADQVTEIAAIPVIGSVSFDRKAQRQPLALSSDPHSLRAEEYRQLRANMRFLQPGETHKVFVVTSSIPGEGKSSTAANIAASLAASGLAVCLVEADLRRPTISALFDLPESAGFSAVLAGDRTIDDALVPWGEDGLMILPAGDMPPNPSELLESAAAATSLQRIRERFDVTIVDCPPLIAVSDAAVLGRMLGGIILVVGERVLRVRDLRRAVDRLAAIGAPVDGAVLNLSRTTRASRYRYTYTPRDGRAAAGAAIEPAPEANIDRHATPDATSTEDEFLESEVPDDELDDLEFELEESDRDDLDEDDEDLDDDDLGVDDLDDDVDLDDDDVTSENAPERSSNDAGEDDDVEPPASTGRPKPLPRTTDFTRVSAADATTAARPGSDGSRS
jgi:succinoglycan biosynthesis transport protein ExoP